MTEESTLSGHPVRGVDRRNGAVIVRLGGELDLYNASPVRTTLLEICAEQPERLVIDLMDVAFIDSTGLGVLIEARSKLRNRAAFLLAAPGLETRRALQISGLDRELSVYGSVDSALGSAPADQ